MHIIDISVRKKAYGILGILFAVTLVLGIFEAARTCAISGGYIAERFVHLPDVSSSLDKNGFTCTGMVYDSRRDEFLIANFGLNLPTDTEFASSIAILNEDLTKVKGEIMLNSLFPDMMGIQGITIDTMDDSIWFCSVGENKIRHISRNGNDLGYFEADGPTGIAYDTDDGTLFVLTLSELMNMTKEGKVNYRIPMAIEGLDQLCYDSSGRKLYITAGINYQGENYVYSFDLVAKKINKVYVLLDSNAIEGIAIRDKHMFIANDGHYHSAKNPDNMVAVYDLSKMK